MVNRLDTTGLFKEFEWNTTNIMAACLIIAAIIAFFVFLAIRGKRKKALSEQPQTIELFDEGKRRRRKKAGPTQLGNVKLFDEEEEEKEEKKESSSSDHPEKLQLSDDNNPDNTGSGLSGNERGQSLDMTSRDSVKGTTGLEEIYETGLRSGTGLPTTLQIVEEDRPERVYAIGNAQHIGMREEQQDSFGISDIFNSEEVTEKGLLSVLADGMGGLENGAESSRRVVSLMLEAFENNNINDDIPEGLRRFIMHVNDQIYREFNHDNEAGMTGSTVVAVLMKDDRAYWISVGDSRIYLFRDNTLTKLNREHNYGTRLDEEALKGIISVTEAENDPDRAALTSYIGIDGLSEIDNNTEPLQLLPGDRIVMCSDGVFSALTEDEMLEVLTMKPQEAAQAMVDRVVMKDRKYQDNTTVIVLGYRIS